MPLTSKQLLENAKTHLEQAHKKLEDLKEELVDERNGLKVERKIHEELVEKNDEMAEDQKYIVMAIEENEIPVLKGYIAETEIDIKRLVKKCEVLSRETWNF